MKHSSTLEFITYTWKIERIPRFVLQELTRHRIASYVVRSSRYTLKELKELPAFEGKNYNKAKNFVYLGGNTKVDVRSIEALNKLQEAVKAGVPNDETKMCMPESYLTDLVVSMNMRSFQNFLNLRTAHGALKEINMLALAMYRTTPMDHRFMLDDFVHIDRPSKED